MKDVVPFFMDVSSLHKCSKNLNKRWPQECGTCKCRYPAHASHQFPMVSNVSWWWPRNSFRELTARTVKSLSFKVHPDLCALIQVCQKYARTKSATLKSLVTKNTWVKEFFRLCSKKMHKPDIWTIFWKCTQMKNAPLKSAKDTV